MAIIPVLCHISWYLFYSIFIQSKASQVVLVVKNPPANAGDTRDQTSIPGSGRSPGEGNGNPLPFLPGEPHGPRGAWWATVHGLARSWTWLKHLSMHACIPSSSAPPSSVTMGLFSISVSLFLFCFIHLVVLFFRFHLEVVTCIICHQ